MFVFPSIETIIRFESEIPEDQDAQFSEGSKELEWFAKFMIIKLESHETSGTPFRNASRIVQ
jgi:hypothetical protein